MRRRPSTIYGFALLFVVGMLSLVAIIGTSLFSMTTLDRSIARNQIHALRARLLMESGIQDAIARLQSLPGGPIEAAMLRDMGYERADRLAFVSAQAEEQNSRRPLPVSVVVNTDGGVMETYALRVADESGKLNLNDPNPACNGGGRRVEEILGIVARELFGAGDADAIVTALFDARDGRPALPGGRFESMDPVDARLRNVGIAESAILRLHEYVTVYSWQDRNVLRPDAPVFGSDPQNPKAPSDLPGLIINRWLEFQTARFDLEARAPVNINTARVELIQALLEPVQGVFIEEGPAENQSSRHYGWWATGLGTRDTTVERFGTVRLTEPFGDERARRLAQAIHDRIHGKENPDLNSAQQHGNDGVSEFGPNPFETWEEYRDFLEHGLSEAADTAIFTGFDFGIDASRDLLIPYDERAGYRDPHPSANPPSGESDDFYRDIYQRNPIQNLPVGGRDPRPAEWWRRYFARAQRDALYANANPNSLLNDWNPNAGIHLMVDKGQLTRSTTEFCFEPTGVFMIASRGDVVLENGEVLATASARAAVQCFDLLRVTSQAQWLGGLGDSRELGEYFSTGGMTAAPITSLSTRLKFCLFPQHSHCDAAGNWQRANLQCYPETLIDQRHQRVIDNRFDGYLMLATAATMLETVYANDYRVLHYAGTANPLSDATQGPDAPYNAPHHWDRGRNRITDDSLIHPTMQTIPGCLLPDGVYSENGRTLAYPLSLGNKSAADKGLNGGVAFWLKPNFHTGVSSRIRKFLCGPTKPGIHAFQQLPALYYLSNPSSAEENGWRVVDPDYSDRVFTQCNAAQPSGACQYGKSLQNHWTPTRSLAFGFAYAHPADRRTFLEGSLTSPSVTRDYPLAACALGAADTGARRFTMPGRQWTHLRVHWIVKGTDDRMSNKKLLLWINGRAIHSLDPDRGGISNRYRYAQYSAMALHPMGTLDLSGEYLRFGEFGPDVSASARPYYGDATYDEVLFHMGVPGAAADNLAYEAGRYANLITFADGSSFPSSARYTSPGYDLQRLFNAPGQRLQLRSVAWTLYRPRFNRINGYSQVAGDGQQDNIQSLTVNPTDTPDPMITKWASYQVLTGRENWDPISVDYRLPGSDDAENSLAWRYQGAGEWDKRLTYPGGSAPDAAAVYAPGDIFQFRAYFHLKYGQGCRLLDSPVLDDVTLSFLRATPRILEWKPQPE